MTATTDLPPYRPCDLCGGVDQDPRHSFAGLIGAPDNAVFDPLEHVRPTLTENIEKMVEAGKLTVTEAFGIQSAFNDTTSTDRHIDCCAAAGCPLSGTDQDAAACTHRAKAADGKTGEGMRKAALSLSKEK